MVKLLRSALLMGTNDQALPAFISRSPDRKGAARMFARVNSRRGREVIVGAAAAVVIGALWLTGVWMTGNLARALDAGGSDVSRYASEPERPLVIGTAAGQQDEP